MNTKILLVLLITFVVFLSGCVQTGQVIGNSENQNTQPTETTQSPETSASNTNPVKLSTLSLFDSKGNPLQAMNIQIDGISKAIKNNVVDISNLSEGQYTLEFAVNGVDYIEDFIYFGQENVDVKVEKPVSTSISVLSKETSQALSNINVYIDGKLTCSTDFSGACSFFIRPDKYSIKLQGEGVLHEELNLIDDKSSDFVFEVERVFPIDITARDEITGDELKNAEIYLDGSFKGSTGSNGLYTIDSVKEGNHNLRVSYEGVDGDPKPIVVSGTQTEFTVSLIAPRSITFILADSETGKPIDNEEVSLESTTASSYHSTQETGNDGKVIIDNIIPGSYKIILNDVNSISKPNKLISIGSESSLDVDLDMPNPILTGSISCDEHGLLDRYGECIVKLKNQASDKSVPTQDTVVLLFAYIDDELVDSDILDFGSILVGDETEEKTTKQMYGFKFNKEEKVVAIIFENYPYMPENDNFVGGVSVSPGLVETAIGDAIEYCTANPHVCAKTVSGLLGAVI